MGSGLKPNAPGERRGGRKAGTPNKATASIKAAFVEAFEQRGGVKALMDWADGNETEFYKLASKLIPTEVNAKVEHDLTQLTDEQLDLKLAAAAAQIGHGPAPRVH